MATKTRCDEREESEREERENKRGDSCGQRYHHDYKVVLVGLFRFESEDALNANVLVLASTMADPPKTGERK